MKIKLGLLVNSKEGLSIIATSKFKATKLFEITKFVKKANEEIESFEKVRQEKIKQYGEEQTNDKGEKVMQVASDKINDFVADIEDLFNSEIDIDVPKILVEDLGDTEMSPNILLSLGYIFENKEDNDGDQ